MLTLAINTSASACEAAIALDSAVLLDRTEAMARGQDARLASFVDEAATEAGVTLADLDRIAVVVGPGSFTGVRIGVAFARGLSLAVNCDVVGLTSLHAALPLDAPARWIALLPAKRRPPDVTFWAQRFTDAAPAGPAEEWGLADARVALNEPNVSVCGLDLDLLSDGDPQIRWTSAAPSAQTAVMRAQSLDVALYPASPIYVREPDAKPMAAQK